MSDEPEVDTNNRELILHFAAQVAAKCVYKIKYAGLIEGHLQETVNIKGVDWHIHVMHDVEDDDVRVFGHRLEFTEEDPGPRRVVFNGFGPPMIQHEPEFDFTCPVAWIPAEYQEEAI